MAATEVESAIFRFMSSLGQGTDWDPEEFDSICEMIPAFKFGILVTGENIKVTYMKIVHNISSKHIFVKIQMKIQK